MIRVPRRCLRCRELFTGPRCPSPACSSREARGYGQAHQAARALLAASLPAPCGYCELLIHPGERWVAAHVIDGKPEYGWKLAHPACNERAKTR